MKPTQKQLQYIIVVLLIMLTIELTQPTSLMEGILNTITVLTGIAIGYALALIIIGNKD